MQCVTKRKAFQLDFILAAIPELQPSITLAPSVARLATDRHGISSSSNACSRFSKIPAALLSSTDIIFQNLVLGKPRWR